MEFKEWLIKEGKSENTVKTYLIHLKGYREWFRESFDTEVSKLYRENILDYISYMLNQLIQNLLPYSNTTNT